NDENGQEFGFTGEVLEVIPQEKIVHTQIFDPGDLGVSMGGEQSIITVTFEEADGVTNVATSINYASKADRDAAFSTGMTEGMELSYKELEGVLADL
ncbi:MAG: SRPBCC domain-containing protein, partial [Acidobacteria bacterium]|nr:SRPBCC domain-containing protein [Acidobacteriota bacterium]